MLTRMPRWPRARDPVRDSDPTCEWILEYC